MAKKKAARPTTRRTPRKPARRAAVPRRAKTKKAASRKSARKPAVRRASKPTRARPSRKTTRVKTSAAPKARARTATARPASKTSKRAAPPARAAATPPPARRRPPSLDRERRTVEPDRFSPLPSSLDLDRSPSAARSGRAEYNQKLHEHTSSSPALTGGDVDADWASAEAVGDEAPGGDNPTPDQDVVDEIGRALGVEYDDDEELRGGDEIGERDRHRWELDPASSDDFDER